MLARGAYQCSDMLASGFKFNFEIQNDAAESSEAKDMQECEKKLLLHVGLTCFYRLQATMWCRRRPHANYL